MALLLLTCVALPALVVAFVAYLALRGSRPRERADILKALAVFAAALLLRAAPGLPASTEDGGAPSSPDSNGDDRRALRDET